MLRHARAQLAGCSSRQLVTRSFLCCQRSQEAHAVDVLHHIEEERVAGDVCTYHNIIIMHLLLLYSNDADIHRKFTSFAKSVAKT